MSYISITGVFAALRADLSIRKLLHPCSIREERKQGRFTENLQSRYRSERKLRMKITGRESRIHEKKKTRYRIDWLRGTPHGHISLVPYPDRMTRSWFA
jgi:hypothetical protein